MSDIFVLTPPAVAEVAPLLQQLRATIVVMNSTANFQSKVVLQSSDDGVTWGSSVDMEANFVGGNRVTTTDWYTNGANFRRAIRVGVLVTNSSGTNVEAARVQLIVDFQSK